VAISEALRLEGVTADVRQRVLIRLRRDLAPWLHREDGQPTDVNAVMVHA
jgi:hypothetical protein